MAQRMPEKGYQEWVGDGVIDVREAAQLTQPELSVKLGVTKQSVWNVEHGRVKPKSEVIRRIAEVCAGEGWLPNDPDAIEEFILGGRSELPLVMRRIPRPNLRLVADEPAVISAADDSAMGGSLGPIADLRLVS